ncbi:MAG: hydroxyphenylacetyl-CoA thioesterase PaaI [Candidatus Eremiobacteraeota bacterium]|nr:hydroxyphenylacetyl-CoA thioesterase PaaI [Candidatus Eremiobacteraeota bacterium]MBV9646125.1 hydroxyphenylacetyl-CoA thioesterase PaaI [Candidatus Eremiobacteraeota bacterium]
MKVNPPAPEAAETADALACRIAGVMYGRDYAAQSMGIEVLEVREAFAVLSMRVRRDMLNGHVIAHGGAVFALADTAFAYACNSRNEPTVALQCTISFTRAAREGETLIARAEERARTRRTSTYDVTIATDGGETIALFRGVGYIKAGTYL